MAISDPTTRRGDTKYAAYPGLHPNYPTAILVDGDPTAVACGLCGANAVSVGPLQPCKAFFAGLKGLKHHLHSAHRVKTTTPEEILSSCSKINISIADARLIKAGSAPSMAIEMTRGSLAVGVEPQSGQQSFATTRSLPGDTDMLANHTGPIHSNYGSVVFLDGKWVAISCHHCGANAVVRARERCFFNGVSGLVAHVRTAHKAVGGPFDQVGVLAFCLRQVIAPCPPRLSSDSPDLAKNAEPHQPCSQWSRNHK